MIKKTLLLLLLSQILTSCLQTKRQNIQANYESIEAEINQQFNGLAHAVKSLDVEAYFEYFDQENFSSLNENGTVTHNFEEFSKTYLKQVPYIKSYQSLKFNNVAINVINDTTVILLNEYDAVVVLTSGESIKASGAGTQVWSKKTGHWKLVNVSGSSK